MEKKAILITSFGTSIESMRAAAIDPLELQLAQAFPDRQPYTAWLSGRIIEKVRSLRGEEHNSLEEALACIAADGVDDLLVQPTCLMQGFESKRVASALEEWDAPLARIALGAPLLATQEDRHTLALFLADEFGHIPASEMMLLMGHGSATGGNEVYEQLNDELSSLGLGHFYVATVEGRPTFSDALVRVREQNPSCVHVAPLMIVAGEHATVDMAGPDEDSWTSQLRAHGFEANPIVRGLGEYPAVRELLVQHAHAAQTVQRKART